MLIRNLGSTDHEPSTLIKVLGEGYPTIAAMAMLCAEAISQSMVTPVGSNITSDQAEANDADVVDLISDEAKTLLVLARHRGTFEIRATQDAFDSTERFLAICVETEPEVFLMFRQKSQPRQSIRFLEGFSQLCRYGLMVHHLNKDFSLSSQGYRVADSLDKAQFQRLAEFGIEAEG
jgi:hypothetical protein